MTRTFSPTLGFMQSSVIITSPISTVTSVIHNTCCTTSHNSLVSAWFEMWLVNTRVLVSWFQIREALLLKKCVMMFLFFIFKGKTTNWKNTITKFDQWLPSVSLEYHHAFPKMLFKYNIIIFILYYIFIYLFVFTCTFYFTKWETSLLNFLLQINISHKFLIVVVHDFSLILY